MTGPAASPSGGVLRQHDFRMLWIGETTSRFGTNITSVALPLVAVITLNASAFWVGALAAAAWLPWLLLALPAGAWVDRMRRRPLMIACDLISLVLLAVVPVLAWTGGLSLAVLLIVALLTGVVSVFFTIAYRVYLPSIVAREDLADANGKLQASESGAQLGGLGLAGVLANLFGAATGLLADAGTFLVSAVCLLGIRRSEPPVEQPAGPRALREEIATGFGFTVRDPYLSVMTGYGAVTNLLLTGYQALITIFIVRSLLVGEAAVGWLIASSSVGGLLGASLATRLAKRFGSARGVLLCKFATAPFGLLIPLAQPGWRTALLALGSVVLAFGVVAPNVILGSFRQQYCPPELLGRVTASYSLANFGAIPIGSLMGGALGSALGVRPALWLLTAGLAISSLLLLVGPLCRARDLPDRPVDAVQPEDAPRNALKRMPKASPHSG